MGSSDGATNQPQPIVLASTSPQRSAILDQLRIPFEAVAPDYDEVDGTSPLERATGKARSVDGGGRAVLGVDTEVLFGGELLGKPASAADAERMLNALSGRTHEVISGLCLRTRVWEERGEATTLVTFRTLTAGDVSRYVASNEWQGRAGAYAIQGLGAALVERIDGDYLNIVGLPGALLVGVLAARFPAVYGFG